jgi:hypothetical protein
MVVRFIGKAFVINVRQSDRCLILGSGTVAPLPSELIQVVKADDHYLVQAQLSVPGAILVTTDTPLREAVVRFGLECMTREEYLRRYV